MDRERTQSIIIDRLEMLSFFGVRAGAGCILLVALFFALFLTAGSATAHDAGVQLRGVVMVWAYVALTVLSLFFALRRPHQKRWWASYLLLSSPALLLVLSIYMDE